LPGKIVSEVTCTVLSGTLNPTIYDTKPYYIPYHTAAYWARSAASAPDSLTAVCPIQKTIPYAVITGKPVIMGKGVGVGGGGNGGLGYPTHYRLLSYDSQFLRF